MAQVYVGLTKNKLQSYLLMAQKNKLYQALDAQAILIIRINTLLVLIFLFLSFCLQQEKYRIHHPYPLMLVLKLQKLSWFNVVMGVNDC